jgi:hypothetical protein
LWAALKAGDIQVVATDHVHRPGAAKAGGIWKAAPGFPGLQTLLPVLLSEGYHKRGVPLDVLARVLSGNPARIMGCQCKGAIAVGRDADFAIVDLARVWTADGTGMHSDAGFSIYDGWQFTGKVIHSMVRGRFVYRDEQLCRRHRPRTIHPTKPCCASVPIGRRRGSVSGRRIGISRASAGSTSPIATPDRNPSWRPRVDQRPAGSRGCQSVTGNGAGNGFTCGRSMPLPATARPSSTTSRMRSGSQRMPTS